ncbi:hypothetical protein GCM10020221_07940 [Streptomyces thioluteus]|uniref:YihY/virulence factor BrkB family protein n=1 Tax=Streptomyces thioluteus TaxID=66431 RepID=A0ABN3WIM9_STRTU
MVIGPETMVSILPWSEGLVRFLYWPVVIVLSIAFLTTLYHVSVPVRSPWQEDIPGALVALTMWVFGSFLLRIYLTHTVEGPTIYGSLAAPVAVLLWIGVSAFAVLVGAAVNAAMDRVWPSVATAAARADVDRQRAAAAARTVAERAALAMVHEYEDDPADPAEAGEDDGVAGAGPGAALGVPRALGAVPAAGGRADAAAAREGGEGREAPQGVAAPLSGRARGEGWKTLRPAPFRMRRVLPKSSRTIRTLRKQEVRSR